MNTTQKIMAFVAGVSCFALTSFLNPDTNKKLVVIDAGHGGKDLGAVYENYNEAAIVETIAEKVKILAPSESIQFVLVRDQGEFMSIDERVTEINSLHPDLVISLHVNAAEDTKSGLEVYVGRENEFYKSSMSAATSLSKHIARQCLKLEAIKNAGFKIINAVKCPAVLLELGFISNAKDRAYITQEKGQNEIAAAIIAAL